MNRRARLRKLTRASSKGLRAAEEEKKELEGQREGKKKKKMRGTGEIVMPVSQESPCRKSTIPLPVRKQSFSRGKKAPCAAETPACRTGDPDVSSD